MRGVSRWECSVERRQFRPFGSVSALTLGGGGLGQIWGDTTREEAVATARLAADKGITHFDMAPMYGRGEAEKVIGEAFRGADKIELALHHQVSLRAGRARYSLRQAQRVLDALATNDGH